LADILRIELKDDRDAIAAGGGKSYALSLTSISFRARSAQEINGGI
jgi:hypothetical protein